MVYRRVWCGGAKVSRGEAGLLKRFVKKVFPWSPAVYRQAKQALTMVHNQFDTPILILLYHRCAVLETDPQLLAVTPENFTNQVKWLKERYPILRFDESWESVREASVVLTFDDGYWDNYAYAVPILERLQVPATIFVSTERIGTGKEPWCDDVERIVLLNNNFLGAKIHLDLRGQGSVGVFIADEEARRELYYRVHDAVRLMQPNEREEILSKIEEEYGAAPVRPSHRYMTEKELQELANSPYITIGGHTVTHSRLSVLSRGKQCEEIEGSIRCLGKIMNKKVTTFSYPFGGKEDYNADSVAIVREMNLKTASNFPGRVYRNTSLYELPRRIVRNWDWATFPMMFQPFWYN